MKKLNPFLCALALALLAASPAAPAITAANADTAEVGAYRLTDAALARYLQATQALRAAKFKTCQSGDDADDDDESESIAETAAKIDAVPAAKAALQSAGISSHEYVVFTFSMLQNAMASQLMKTPGAKLPPGINPANVEFIRKHEADMQALAKGGDEADAACGEDDGA
jgi:hypothetical protein